MGIVFRLSDRLYVLRYIRNENNDRMLKPGCKCWPAEKISKVIENLAWHNIFGDFNLYIILANKVENEIGILSLINKAHFSCIIVISVSNTPAEDCHATY